LYAALITAPTVSKGVSADAAFLQFIPFAVLLAGAIFLSYTKEKWILYPDEVEYDEQQEFEEEPASGRESSYGKDNDTEIPKG
jgi:hypothetical protein